MLGVNTSEAGMYVTLHMHRMNDPRDMPAGIYEVGVIKWGVLMTDLLKPTFSCPQPPACCPPSS